MSKKGEGNTKHFRIIFLLIHPPLTLAKGSWPVLGRRGNKTRKFNTDSLLFYRLQAYQIRPMLGERWFDGNVVRNWSCHLDLDILTPLNVWLLHYLNRTGKPWDLPGVGKGRNSLGYVWKCWKENTKLLLTAPYQLSQYSQYFVVLLLCGVIP